jgi:hypothetical protein
VSSWSSFHPTRVAHKARAGGGVVPVVHRVLSAVIHRVSSTVVRPVSSTVVRPVSSTVVRPVSSTVVRPVSSTVVRPVSSPIVHRVSSPVIRHRSTHDPPHEQLLVRLGRVVHRRMSSIIVVPSHLSFPHRLLSVIPSVVRHRRRTALVHPQSTRRAVAHQRGGGCSVDRRHCPRRRCSLFVVVVPVRCRHPCSLLSSPSSSFIIRRCHSRRRHSSFIVVHPSIPIPHPPIGCSSSSVVHPLVPPTVHPTSSCL